MKKFRSLLLSMVMLASVCPLYGFTPVNAVKEEAPTTTVTQGEEDNAKKSRREYVVKALNNAIDAIQDAQEEIGAEYISRIEASAEKDEKTALDYVQTAYNTRDNANAKLEEYADKAVEAHDVAHEAAADAAADQKAAELSAKDADKQEAIAEHTWKYPVADQAADNAFEDAKVAFVALGDAIEQNKVAQKKAAEARKAYDDAEAEYVAAQKKIDEALEKGVITAQEAAEKTAAAEAETKKKADALNQAEKEADEAKEYADHRLGAAKMGLFVAVKNLKDAIKDCTDGSVLARMEAALDETTVLSKRVAAIETGKPVQVSKVEAVTPEKIIKVAVSAVAVRNAGVTLANAQVANNVATAKQALIKSASDDADADYAAAKDANAKAQTAKKDVEKLAAQGVYVNAGYLKKAYDAACDATEDSLDTADAIGATKKAADATKESADEARAAAHKLKPKK